MPVKDTPPPSAKVVSVVLGSYNRLGFLKLTIDSVRKELESCPFSHEIIVVDGGSTDGTLKWLARQRDIVAIIQHNRGEWRGKKVERRSWGYFMNLGFKCCQGKYICMLSDDCLVIPGAIANGVEEFERALAAGRNVGAAAFYWRNWPEEQHFLLGLTLGNRMFVNHGLYLRSALEAVGYVDEESYSFYHADGDLCLKLWQRGIECIAAPDSFIEHYSHANLAVRASNAEQQKTDWATYLKKWQGIFFHPELNDIGSWIEKSFHDPARTAERFKRVDRLRWLGRSVLRKLKPGK